MNTNKTIKLYLIHRSRNGQSCNVFICTNSVPSSEHVKEITVLNFIQFPAVFQFSNLIKTGSFTKKIQISIKWVCCLFFFFPEKAKEKSGCPKQRINRALIRIESHELNRCFELPLLLKHNPLHEAHWISYQFQNIERKCLFGLTQEGLINYGMMMTVLHQGNSLLSVSLGSARYFRTKRNLVNKQALFLHTQGWGGARRNQR